MEKVYLLGIHIDNLSTVELLKKLEVDGGVVFTPNVDHLAKLQKDRDFYQAYCSATYRVCDSQILMYILKILGRPIKEKISGSALLPAFYKYHKNNEGIKIFLLGAAEGVAELAKQRINQEVGRDIVVSAYSPSFGFEKDENECLEIVDIINRSGATVLAIGVGAPKQEKWIVKYKDKLENIKIFLAVGATIDFEAGSKKRSPQWMSSMGLEWLHRLLSEPRRLGKRYLIEDVSFLGSILKRKLKAQVVSVSQQKQFTSLDRR